jgi:hypothetical protein
VKVKTAGKYPLVAKANRYLSIVYGTAKAVPFQNQSSTTCRYRSITLGTLKKA